MGIFGWSYPPGAANDPSAPYNQVDPPCAVCGNFEDDCICPECPVCKCIGDPSCYIDVALIGCVGRNDSNHGLRRTQDQSESLAAAERRWAEENAE